MTTKNTPAQQTGIVVTTSLKAGPTPQSIRTINLRSGFELNHAEGIVVSTPITAGGIQFNHAEGIVVSTSLKAGPTPQGIRVLMPIGTPI